MASEEPESVCIIDTDATVEQFLRIAVMRADVILVVVEPFYTSLMAGERMTRLGRLQGYDNIALLANKVRDDAEREQVYDFAREHGLEVAGVVPYDDRMPRSEFAQAAPIDYEPDTPAVQAIDEIARRLFAEHGRHRSPEAADCPE
jgi:CO dehydrogenase maturation factor